MNNKNVQVGKIAPDFETVAIYDEESYNIRLSDYRKKKYVVLFFYPLNFTFVCPTEITAFNDRFKEFSSLDTEVLGVSVDSEYSHLLWTQTTREEGGVGLLQYPLVSDIKKEISNSYNVLHESGVALRGLFIIDKKGIIQYSTTNNLSFGRSVDETLRILQAIHYITENPDEVCPSDWEPGLSLIHISEPTRPY